MKNAIECYSRDIAQYGVIDKELVAAAQEGLKSHDPAVRAAAREQLICSCLRMVVKRAAAYAPICRIPVNDLISVGNEALVLAGDQYDPGREVKFSTYACSVIQYRMIAYIRKIQLSRRIEVQTEEFESPRHDDQHYDSLHQALETLTRFEQEILHFSFFDDFRPSDEEIAEKLRISVSFLKQQRKQIYHKLRCLLEGKYA